MKYLNWSIITKERMLNYLKDYKYSRLNGLNIRYSLNDLKMLDKEMFYKHLVGFMDGDGSFRSGRRDNGTRYSPTITFKLHKDDVDYMSYVAKVLNVSNTNFYTNKKDNTLALIISKQNEIKDIILPIFDTYKLLGAKKYDYELWRNIVIIYNDKINLDKSTRLRICDDYNIALNTNSEIHTPNYDYVMNNINNEYILGFIEAEGYFGIKYQNKKFHVNIEISQHKNSENLLKGIQNTIINWPCDNNLNYELKPLTNKLYPDQNKYRIIISGVDRLYYQIIPTILNNELYTRKYIDFIMWTVSVIIIKHGLHKTTIGVDLLNHIRSTINSKRYSTNNKLLPSINDIMKVLDITPIYNPTLSHEYNYRNNRKSKL